MHDLAAPLALLRVVQFRVRHGEHQRGRAAPIRTVDVGAEPEERVGERDGALDARGMEHVASVHVRLGRVEERTRLHVVLLRLVRRDDRQGVDVIECEAGVAEAPARLRRVYSTLHYITLHA